ncbi:MAG: hypothetical protein B9S32_08780 [Verrucomicrobia bacterium Tous-C9LFEB]|nr:MAG: hypothetical protein B9S32_08780 [Verrucomicrobia bacterium Tous-C9LFEB]
MRKAGLSPALNIVVERDSIPAIPLATDAILITFPPAMDHTALPTVVYYVAASLDGFIATPEGGLDWLTRYDKDPEVAQDFPAFEQTIDSLVMGSKTYEFLLQHGTWPHPGKPCWVLTSRTLPALSPDILFTQATPRQILEEAAQRGCRRLWLVGGGAVAGTFQRDGLINEYRITYAPIILGAGIPLFSPSTPDEPLRTVSVKPFACGLTQIQLVRE